MLAGEPDFVAEARLWQIRVGAVLPSAFPLALSGLVGLDERLPEIAGAYRRAAGLAARLAREPGLAVSPNPPHSPAFQLFLNAAPAALEAAALPCAEASGFWLAGAIEATAIPGWSKIEVALGRGARDWTDDEAAAAIRAWLERASAASVS